MNAIVALCHFCEAHGPRSIFCTYSGSGTETAVATAATPQPCSACSSLGADTVLMSRADNAVYYSREALPSAELATVLRQAAIRSLTCEVSWSKEGGTVYFSEGSACRVLSSTFQLRDSRARGLRRWFACLVLMKDQVQLLNMMPFFSEHIKKSAAELQALATAVYNEEQRLCSQRALRLNTGLNDFGPSRSLQQLTGEKSIFHRLHTTYTWMLHAGAHTYTETLHTSRELRQRAGPDADRARVMQPGASLRLARDALGCTVFRKALYCALTGIEVLLKSERAEMDNILRALRGLLPASDAAPRVQAAHSDEPPAPERCVLEEVDGGYECQWTGELPSKCPTLMTRIESAMSNSKFNDSVLDQHIKYLQLEWLGNARTLKNAIQSSGASSEPVGKLKQVLGVAPHDEKLINYWLQAFCCSVEYF